MHYNAWRQAFSIAGVEFTSERFYAMAGMPTEKIIATLAAENGLQLDAAELATAKEKLFLNRLEELQPREDICAVARQHHGVIPMAVASGSQRYSVHAQLRQIGVIDLFDAIVTAEDTVNHKPAPDVFLRAAELIGVPAQGCRVYEDSTLGIQAAVAAGMDYVDVR